MQRHTVAVTELVKLLKEINQRLLLPTHNMFTQHGREDAFKKDLVQEVTKKNHLPVLAISTDGVVRFTIFEDKLHLVDGKKLPSSISGQTIEQSWNIIKKDYAERIEKIAHALI